MSEYIIDKFDYSGNTYKIDYSRIPYGTIDANSTSTVFNATVDGITELSNGVCALIKNGVITSAAGCTLNVNNLGAKPIYNSMAESTRITTMFNKTYTFLFVYNTVRVSTGCWDMYYGYYTNSTYSNATLGQGYGICQTPETTLTKTVSIPSYGLAVGGIVAVKFTYAVPANSALSISSKTARAIYYRGTAITDGIINAGDTGVFIYNDYHYHLLTVDKSAEVATTMTESEMKTGTATTGRTITAARLKQAVEYHSPVPEAESTDVGKSLQVDSNGDWSIADILAWKKLGEYVGPQSPSVGGVQLPDNIHEILVAVNPNGNYRVNFTIPIDEVFFTSQGQRYITNYYSIDYNGWIRLDLGQNSYGNNFVNLNQVYSGNTNFTSNAYWWIFYR